MPQIPHQSKLALGTKGCTGDGALEGRKLDADCSGEVEKASVAGAEHIPDGQPA